MAAPQGLACFPGITQILDGSFAFVQGISPAVCTLTIVPQQTFPAAGGTLRFSYAGQEINWPDCKIDTNSLQRNAQGYVWQLAILDRRWKWRWGLVRGHYNLPNPDGTIRDGTEKTPHELATLCLEAIDEENYSLAGLPNAGRPEVHWEGRVPMEALADLCDDYGCCVVLKLDNRVSICRTGEGAELPIDDTVLSDSLVVDPPERPDELAVLCGPSLYQVDLPLEAVGEDTDGSIRPLDELSYTPSAGWSGLDLPFQVSVITDKRARELAKATVYRWYRVRVDNNHPLTVPGYERKITDRTLLDLDDCQMKTKTQDNVVERLPAAVYGSWFVGVEDLSNNVTAVNPSDIKAATYDRNFVLDCGRQIVRFSEPVFRNTQTASLVPAAAQLYLRTAVRVRHPDTRHWIRAIYRRELGRQFRTPVEYLPHDELALTREPTYNAAFGVRHIATNSQALQQECDEYLDAAEQLYETHSPRTVRYAGLRRLDLDGAIRQVVYAVGPRGADTVAARNNEAAAALLPLARRRREEQQRQLATIRRRFGFFFAES